VSGEKKTKKGLKPAPKRGESGGEPPNSKTAEGPLQRAAPQEKLTGVGDAGRGDEFSVDRILGDGIRR